MLRALPPFGRNFDNDCPFFVSPGILVEVSTTFPRTSRSSPGFGRNFNQNYQHHFMFRILLGDFSTKTFPVSAKQKNAASAPASGAGHSPGCRRSKRRLFLPRSPARSGWQVRPKLFSSADGNAGR
jgi:hypothetical protein